jgi:small subunit ribosomal protein S13
MTPEPKGKGEKPAAKDEAAEKPGKEGKEASQKQQPTETKGFQKKDKPREKHEMRVLVRVLGTDLDGEKAVGHALLKVKGISHTYIKALLKGSNIDPKRKLGAFTESELMELEGAIKDPQKIGVQTWLLNRRRDLETGKDNHVSGSDVDVVEKFDIQRLVDKKSYKGVRHMLGLPVRGQRTRSSFRKGHAVGVVRKSVRLAMGAGAKPAGAADDKKK